MKVTSFLLAGIMLAGSFGLAQAQDQTQGAGGGRGGIPECQADMAKYCSGKTGADRRQCMQDNQSKLSDTCKAAMAARASSRANGGGQ